MEQIRIQISSFHQIIELAIEQLLPPLDDAAIHELLVSIQNIGKEAIAIGDLVAPTTDQDILQRAQTMAIHYLWIDEVKQNLILWRDTLFEYQKSRIFFLDNNVARDEIEQLHQSTTQVLQKALESLKSLFNTKVIGINNEKEAIRKIERWHEQENPWPIYQNQLRALVEQSEDLWTHNQRLVEVASVFENISKKCAQISDSIANDVVKTKRLTQESIDFIQAHLQEPGKVIYYLDSIEEQLKSTQNLKIFKEAIESELEQINTVHRIPIDTVGGLIQNKEVNFSKDIRQWLESEIQPSLYDMIDISERAVNATKMSLINIRNRAIILSKETKEDRIQDPNIQLCQPLRVLLKNIQQWSKEINEVEDIVKTRLEHNFRISNVFNTNQEFLPVPNQSTLLQMRWDQNELLAKVRIWVKDRTVAIQNIRNTVLKEESMSDAEKIIRYVKSRSYNHDPQHYDSIFTTEGFIGESFCVGRKQELEYMETLIANWRVGFRGAVVLHGMRFCGKSLFGEMISHHYFQNNTIALRPNNVINIYGRRLVLGNDLGEALDFVKKYATERKKIVWIDDLELWGNSTVSVIQNIKNILRHIDRGNKFFYMLSMSTWSYTHYDQLFGLQDSIPSSINLNKMSLEEVKRAILIRHGATHKILIDKEGKRMSSGRFNNVTREFYRRSKGNIGEALRLWAASSKVIDDDKVHLIDLPRYDLPDFIDDNEAIVLRTVMLYKQTNEYQLNKQFGPAFKGKYNVILQRLIDMGVLHRREDEMLEVREGLINNVAELLDLHGYIKLGK